MSFIDSGGTGGFESITFSAPITSLVVNAGAGNDSIAIESLDSAFSSTSFSMIINAGDGDDTIVVESLGSGFSGALTLDGGSGSDIATVSETVTTPVTVSHVAPAVTPLVLDPTVIDENGTVTLTGTFTDPGARDDHEVVIDWADGTSDTISNKKTFFDGTFDDTAWVEHVVPYGNGGSATARQQASGTDTSRRLDISLSQAPAGGISQVGVYSIRPSAVYDPAAEGEIFALDFQLGGVELPATDVDLSFKAALRQDGQYYSTRHFALESPGQERTFTETDFVLEGQANVHPDFSAAGSPIEFGFVAGAIIFDGSLAVSVVGGFDDWTLTVHRKMRSFTATHQYLDDNPTATASDVYTITATVTDDDGGSASSSTTLTVNNVVPDNVAINDAAISTYVFAVGDSATFSGSFTDVGTPDTHTAVWTFSHVNESLLPVITTKAGTVTQFAGSGSVSDSLSFADAGVYTVTLTIKDDDTGAATSEESMFVVYDPSAQRTTAKTSAFPISSPIRTSPSGADSSLFSKFTFLTAVARYALFLLMGATSCM